MKAVSVDLAALINSGDFAPFDCYTIDMVGGGRLMITAADFDVVFGGSLWSAMGPRIVSAARGHWKCGLDVDQWSLVVAPRRRDELTDEDFPDRIGTVPWLQAAAQGMLDGAAVTVARAYFGPQGRGIDIFPASDLFQLEDVFARDAVALPTYPLPTEGVAPVGMLTMFKGNVAEVAVDTTTASMTLVDARQILTTQMPRNLYQAACRHRLFDVGCQLDSAAYAQDRTVAAGTTRAAINFAPAWSPVGSRTLTLGRVRVMSGANAGARRSIAYWNGGFGIALTSPFAARFAIGDVVRLFPGCDKTMSTCGKFGNLLNYGGEPFIPVPETTA